MCGKVGVIKKLDNDVINRIAAGEVIQRPVNALKELIENSLDAKSTNIQITIKNGGLKLLQDNGTGIRKEDFEIICERFTTSKLTEFEDLQKIATFGFRGEALASISHVAHLSITSKTKMDICAYQAEYNDGKLKGQPKPLAGNQGTVITVEDLFYNMTVRKQALRTPSEEYQKIYDLVTKYAIHNPTVGFALKKHTSSNDLRTPINSNHIENVRLIYGNTIASGLIEFHIENKDLEFNLKGYITNVNYSHKKYQFFLFINNRLVDCQGLKKSIDAIYQTYLPKNNHPFVYLSLELNSYNVDVNVHPTKHEVNFLNEAEIIESITTALEEKLLGSNSARIFYTQAKLPTMHFDTKETLNSADKTSNLTVEPKYIVRTDSNLQKLDKFFEVSTIKKATEETIRNTHKEIKINNTLNEEDYEKCHEEFLKDHNDFRNKLFQKSSDNIVHHTETIKQNKKTNANHNTLNVGNDTTKEQFDNRDYEKNTKVGINTTYSKIDDHEKTKEISLKAQEAKKCQKPLSTHLIKKVTRVETKLTSILKLRKAVENNCHRTLRETFAQHVFVGSINPNQALIQYNTQLLLCNTNLILEAFFYQLILYNFQNFDSYRFEDAMSIKELALIGLNLAEAGWTEDDGPKDELAQRISEILVEKGPMLNEYFSLNIDEQGKLRTLPILLDNYVPDALNLPLYVIRLATEVKWDTEKECFDSFAQETATFFAKAPNEDNVFGKSWKWVTEHILYPAIKEYFLPPKHFSDNGGVLEIANLPNLYKVFERC
ncbi:hypothetical protein GWI33_004702 [Rhynchophorus ferrugineus]|uniref:DNA mismatch repair protein S5 domain-containing protein n=1 Tax=Rhynchophorus ferrugineus TaxID=354439 RepID=A0A834MJW9_RHYFE|nr:hypothetical protein GWI33_004702 [Rhynchophorus ferrugineus]